LLNVMRRCLDRLALVMSGLVLVACGSTSGSAKPGDKIALIFMGKSNSEYRFTLENPTSHAIYLRVTKSLWFALMPVDTAIECKNEKTGEATIGGFPLFDSVTGGKDPPTIEVSPGTAIKLKITDPDSLLAKHKGETCKMHLRLQRPDIQKQQGDVIDSMEFES